MHSGGYFGVWDYAIFFAMLLSSSAIGIYYAFATANKPQAPRSMGVIPVAMSLISTSISPVAMLGIPAEMYFYGLEFVVAQVGLFFTVLLTNYVYMPKFYNLQVTSAFQYLELRFNRTLRTICSVSSALQMTVYMSIVLYGPALALQQVTGVNLWLSVVSIGVVCTFYTTIGGIKAIVMADVFMSFIKYASIILLAAKGTVDVGGGQNVFERNLGAQRLNVLDFRPDPTVRHSVWSLVIGGTFLWLTLYAVNQGWVQRYLSMPSVAAVRRAMWVNLLGVVALQTALCYVGLVIFARYSECDPISTRQVTAADQLNPFFVMDILGNYPGVPGLIVSGIFSGGLSGVSASLSSLATTTLQDIIKTYIKPDLGDRASGITLKILTVVFGVIVVAMVYVAQQMGDVLQSALSILGIVGGPLVGVYTLGIFVPFANSIGAITGLVSGVVALSWISVGAYIRRPLHWRPPVSVDGCVDLYLNVTGLEQPVLPSVDIDAYNSQIEYIYRLSYLWYSFVGALIAFVLGCLISLVTARWSSPVDEQLLIRFSWNWLRRRKGNKKISSLGSTENGDVHRNSLPKDDVEFPGFGSSTVDDQGVNFIPPPA
ncbi:sodium-coupled monocarboxylate transporter 1-like [Haemaphysalis longicornis]